MRVSKYLCRRLLRSTPTTKIDVVDRDLVSVNDDNLVDDTKEGCCGCIVSVDMASLSSKYSCENCTNLIDISAQQNDDD